MNECYRKLPAKYFVCYKFFLPTELLLIHPILIWPRPKCLDIIWKNILNNILSNDYKMQVVYHKNFLVGKKFTILFLVKIFPSSFAVNIWQLNES